jgi:hypothetical protein
MYLFIYFFNNLNIKEMFTFLISMIIQSSDDDSNLEVLFTALEIHSMRYQSHYYDNKIVMYLPVCRSMVHIIYGFPNFVFAFMAFIFTTYYDARVQLRNLLMEGKRVNSLIFRVRIFDLELSNFKVGTSSKFKYFFYKAIEVL